MEEGRSVLRRAARAFARGLARTKAHPCWTFAGALGFLTAIDIIDAFITGNSLMEWAFGEAWATVFIHSAWFKALALAVMLFALWRIGALSLKEEASQTAVRQEALNNVNSRIDDLYERSARLPQLLAARAMHIEEAREAQEVVTRARDTLSAYQKRLSEAQQFQLGRSPHSARPLVEEALRSALMVMREAQTTLGVTPSVEPEIKRPDLVGFQNEHQDGDLCYRVEDNSRFFDAHVKNIATLETEIDKLERTRLARAQERASIQTALDEHMRGVS